MYFCPGRCTSQSKAARNVLPGFQDESGILAETSDLFQWEIKTSNVKCPVPGNEEKRLGLEVGGQEGNDVWERMKNAFEYCFSRGVKSSLLIGSDIPDLPPVYVQRAFEGLNTCDAILGPAHDGGYYLIGFTSQGFTPVPFTDIQWGTPSVYGQTIDNAKVHALKVCKLPRWQDVDTLDDLKALPGQTRLDTSLAPNTIEVINKMAKDIPVLGLCI